MRKTRKRKSRVWTWIGIVCLLLLIALGVLFFVLYQRNGEIKDIQAKELAKQQEYTALITDTAAPEGWDEATMSALQEQALAAYDSSFLTTIDSALDGQEDAITEVLDKKSSTQPDSVAEYTTLFNNLSSYPVSLGKLLVKDPDSMDLILSYSGSSTSTDGNAALSQDLKEGIPNLKTFDPAWGFVEYGNGLMATDGSAPTAVSMVFSHIFNDPEMTPLYFADFAKEYGYDQQPVKNDSSLFSAAAWTYGVNLTPLNGTPTSITDSLQNGGTVIMQYGTKDDNHFVVIDALNEDGTWNVLDPTVSEETITLNPEDTRDQIVSAYSYW